MGTWTNSESTSRAQFTFLTDYGGSRCRRVNIVKSTFRAIGQQNRTEFHFFFFNFQFNRRVSELRNIQSDESGFWVFACLCLFGKIHKMRICLFDSPLFTHAHHVPKFNYLINGIFNSPHPNPNERRASCEMLSSRRRASNKSKRRTIDRWPLLADGGLGWARARSCLCAVLSNKIL